MPARKTRAGKKKLRVTQRRSSIGYASDQKRTLEAMGLGRIDGSVVLPDNPQTRGMIFKVRHLLEVEEVKG